MGPDAAEGGVVDLARRYSTVLNRVHVAFAFVVMAGAYLLRPAAGPVLRLYAITSPPGDRAVFAKPEMRAMFLDDLLMAGRRGIRAPTYDVLLFGRDWGFSVRDVTVPVHWWHGDADHIIPLRHGEHVASLLPDVEFHLRTVACPYCLANLADLQARQQEAGPQAKQRRRRFFQSGRDEQLVSRRAGPNRRVARSQCLGLTTRARLATRNRPTLPTRRVRLAVAAIGAVSSPPSVISRRQK